MVFKENVYCLYTKGFAPPFANYIIILSFYVTKKFSRFVVFLCSFHMHLALLQSQISNKKQCYIILEKLGACKFLVLVGPTNDFSSRNSKTWSKSSTRTLLHLHVIKYYKLSLFLQIVK